MASIAALLGLSLAPQILGSITSLINPNAPPPPKSSLEKLIDFLTTWLPIILIAGAVLYGINLVRPFFSKSP